MNAIPLHKHWPAHLRLNYTGQNSRTVISKRQHHGPLNIQKPFYPEGGVCHTYLLHPPGGIASGDDLHIDIQLNHHAHGLLTTPASGKFYRSNGSFAHVKQHFSIDQSSLLEWMPQENIFFTGARVQQHTRFQLSNQARLLAWDISCFGRPACNEPWDKGDLDQRTEVWRDDKPLFIERNLFNGEDALMSASWGLAGQPVSALMLACPATRDDLKSCQETLSVRHGMVAPTLIGDLLVVRYLGAKVEEAKNCFFKVWQRMRPALAGTDVCVPRIWFT